MILLWVSWAFQLCELQVKISQPSLSLFQKFRMFWKENNMDLQTVTKSLQSDHKKRFNGLCFCKSHDFLLKNLDFSMTSNQYCSLMVCRAVCSHHIPLFYNVPTILAHFLAHFLAQFSRLLAHFLAHPKSVTTLWIFPEHSEFVYRAQSVSDAPGYNNVPRS